MRKPLLSFLTVLLLFAQWAHAQVLSERIPADALVYVGWQGADKLAPQYAKSNLKGVIDASTLPAYLEQKAPEWIAMATDGDEKKQALAAQFTDVAKAMWKYPAALYAGPVDLKDPNNPGIAVAIVCQSGPNTQALAATVKKLVDAAAEEAEEDLTLASHTTADAVIVTLGTVSPEALNTLLAKGGNALNQSDAFQKTLANVDKDAAVTVYADLAAARKLALDVMAASSDDDARTYGPKIIDALGLNSLTTMAYTGSFAGEMWSDRAFVGVNGPRKGILTLFGDKTVGDDLLKRVPKDTASFIAFRLDVLAAFKNLRESIKNVEPKAAEDFEEGLAEIREEIGIDLEKDVFTPMGDQWVLIRSVREGDMQLPMGMGILNVLKDAKTAQATLITLIVKAKESGAPFDIEEKEVNGAKITFASPEFMPFAFGWSIHEDTLAAGLLEDVEAFLNTRGKENASILANDSFAALKKQLPNADKAVILDYAHPGEVYNAMLPQLQQIITMMNGFGQAGIPDGALPDYEKVKDYMDPGMSFSYSDNAGIHMRGLTAFPGAGLLVGQQSSAAAGGALAAAILVPSLGAARQSAQRTLEAGNLNAVTKAAIIHAMDNNDQLPDHLAQLVASNMLTPKVLVSRRTGTKPLDLTPELMDKARKDWNAIAKDLDAHSDILYVGKGLTFDDGAADQIVAYMNPAKVFSKKGLNVAFADGHVEFVPASRIEEVFTTANKLRKEKNLPALPIPALAPATKPKN